MKKSIYAVIIVCAIILTAAIIRHEGLQTLGTKCFEQEVIPKNVDIIRATLTASPIQIKINSSSEFVAKIVELNAEFVYKQRSGSYTRYYVFSQAHEISYYFTPVFDFLTGEMVN